MTDEGQQMAGVKFDWTVNVSTMLAIGAMAGAATLGWFNLREQVNLNTLEIVRVDGIQKDLIAKRESRILEVDRRLNEVGQLSYRLGGVEGQMTSITARLDASFARFSERLDRASEMSATGFNNVAAELAGLKTQIAVLSQRVDGIAPERKAELRMGAGVAR